MQSYKFNNRLLNETSPYLLQHAHNPVDWYPWGPEALQKAQDEDKPILVSIGYSACHWCHVMERESFEDEATAAIMNRFFVNVKIDREERPDLDHIYMDAVQAMTGSGGWPLNVFLTPDAKPFYGGTYFPPVRAYNRMSWKETLESIHEAYHTRRDDIEAQADNLVNHIETANAFGIPLPTDKKGETFFDKANLQTMADNLLAAADSKWGGFGRPPKFPQTFSIQFLLRHYHFSGHRESLQQALLSLDKMMHGGIYDHLGGGFSRYSTDEKWLAPHFEKMLYDNALLLNVFAEAYLITGEQKYRSVVEETLGFMERELRHPDGGFFSALDADSEGVEGQYYTWSKAEIEKALGDDAELFCAVYNVSERGNWEHTNILWLPSVVEDFTVKFDLKTEILSQKLAGCRALLLNERARRIRPQLDDKILLGWNALTITAICKAAAATGNKEWLNMAEKSMDFIEEKLCTPEGAWLHTWKNGEAKYYAFLDDLAALVQAYLHLFVLTGREQFLKSARTLATMVIEDFSDEVSLFFQFTSRHQDDVIVRKKEVYDGAIPSGNALMAENFFHLSVYYDLPEWQERALSMARSLASAIIRYPSSFGVWAMFVQSAAQGLNEIAIVGEGADDILAAVNRLYIPNKVVMSASKASDAYSLLRGKLARKDQTLIYLCRNFACKQPVSDVESLLFLLNRENVQ
ncbi:MAG TPA: thioredoxin domain-containing protein [Panacibacter sp.]|nr:thioredoxin domain-containing protein [Panacibacter sp.]HNP44963.1 thioredoxin domain-containing protein [Panacibacter sp.]